MLIAAVLMAQSYYNGLTLGTINDGDCLTRSGTAIVGVACGGGGSVPIGAIVFVISGSCPAGYAEVAALNGRMPVGTLAANANVGTTGGSDSITTVLNHTHPVTDPGHIHQTQRYPTATGTSSGFTIDTSMSGTLADNTLPVKSATTGVTTNNPAGGVASIDNRSAFVRVIACQKE